MKYEAILFDLDGTLIDSIPLWIQAYQTTLQEYGAKFTEEEFMQDIYLAHKSLGEAMTHYNVKEDEKLIRTLRDSHYCNLVATSPLWYPKAEQAFNMIRATYPVAIITGSWGPYIQAENKAISLSEMVDVIITMDETRGQGKPDPYGILLACERMEINPKNCIYIGDVMMDAEAAQRAGMPSFIIHRSHTPKEAIEAADYTGKSLEDVVTHLELA